MAKVKFNKPFPVKPNRGAPGGGVGGFLQGAASGGLSNILSVGSDEKEPFHYPALQRKNPAAAQHGYMIASDFARATGQDNLADRLSHHVRPGGPAVDNPFTRPDGSVDWESLGPGGAGSQEANAWINRLHAEHLTRAGNNGAKFDMGNLMNRSRVNQAKQTEGAMKQGLISEIDPTLKMAQERSTALMGTSAIDGGMEQAMRSRVAAQSRTAASTRLNQLGAGIGLGHMQNSPAAAALAAFSGEQADSALISTLSDIGIQVSETNRAQQRADIDLATRIAGARHAILNGDSKSIIGMQGDIASMIDSFYARDQAVALQQQAVQQAGQGNKGAIAQGAISGAATGMAAGPYGALAGAAIGAGGAYLSQR